MKSSLFAKQRIASTSNDATSLLFAFDAEGKITGVSARPASCEPGHLDLLIQYSTIK